MTGTTEKELLAGTNSPKYIQSVRFYNADSANITVTLYKKVSGTLYGIDKATLSPGTSITFSTSPAGPQGEEGAAGETGPAGADGADGADGTNGQGVPTGGTTGQILAKNSNTNYDTEWVDASGGGALRLGNKQAATIATGVLTVDTSHSFYAVSGEDNTNDNLLTISGGEEGQIIVLQAVLLGGDITIVIGDNIFSNSDSGRTLVYAEKSTITLIKKGPEWVEMAWSKPSLG